MENVLNPIDFNEMEDVSCYKTTFISWLVTEIFPYHIPQLPLTSHRAFNILEKVFKIQGDSSEMYLP